MTAQESSPQNAKNGRVSAPLGHFSKTDIRYWQERLFRETYRQNGKLRQTSHWYARIQLQKGRERFPLGTANKAAAAAKARDIYLFLAANGWKETLEKYKPETQIAPTIEAVTIGSFLDAVFSVKTNRSTIEGYATAFRKIVADIFGLSDDKSKYDFHSGGRAKWVEKIHAISLREITPAKINEWKQSFVAAASADPLMLRKARISVNAIHRRARSLFSPKLLRQIKIALPSPLPFDGVEFEPRQSMKYRSDINVLKLIKSANKELEGSDRSAYSIFLLAVTAGLRRKEIDLLEWTAFRFSENVIRIEPTKFFHPKSEDSIADVQVDSELMAIFRRFHKDAKGLFVVPSLRRPKTVTRGDYYRCEPHFERLNSWLRSKGVTTQKPLHTLRKEYGSLVNQAHGIHAASRALRHADINVTNNYYTDSRIRVTPGLGKMFAARKKPQKKSQTA
jgi:integrase